MPMQTIGYLLGIPEGDQANIRDTNGVSLELASGATPGEASSKVFEESITLFAEYIEWRAAHPSDDLMTDLLQAEVEEPDGTKRRLSRTEVLSYTAMIAGAGNETTARLIGFMAQLLSDHPDQRRELGADPSLIPGRSRRRCGSSRRHRCRLAMSPVRHRITGRWCPRVPFMLLLNGSANRDDRHFRQPRRVRHPPRRKPSEFRPGTALLPGIGAGSAGSASRV